MPNLTGPTEFEVIKKSSVVWEKLEKQIPKSKKAAQMN
jgi:hypothetical protein